MEFKIKSVEVNPCFLRTASIELDEGAQLLNTLSERCCRVAGSAENWKFDIEGLAPETYERVREVIGFLFEISYTLNFVSRDLSEKCMDMTLLTEKKEGLKAA